MADAVNNPDHYESAAGQAWDVLDVWFADDPLLWNCGKYLARAGKKGDKLTDLLKAEKYLKRRIAQLERKNWEDVKGKVFVRATEVDRDGLSYPPHDAWERK